MPHPPFNAQGAARPAALADQAPLPTAAAIAYEEQVLAWAHAQALPEDVVVTRDCAYGPHSAQRYDVFARRRMRNAPILMFWHGGGWTNGCKEYVSFMAEAVTRLGMILVTPGYRLAPSHRLPAAFEDSLAVVSHVATHASSFGGRADQLYLAGHSAGGHLAALVALRRADALQAGIDPDAIRACLPISGIMDLHHPDPSPDSMEERVYTTVLAQASDDVAMSPLNWCAGAPVPMWLSLGEMDSERVCRSNQQMAAQLATQGASHRLHMESGLDHFSTHTSLRDPGAPWYGRLANLLSIGTP